MRCIEHTSNRMSKVALRSYDQIADIYDDDMGQNMPFDDVGYYVACAREKPQGILELGCGTGRITLPLLKAGLNVTAADISPRMISYLRRKLTQAEANRLQLVQMDIRRWALRGAFSTILCPYSLFTYLLSTQEQNEFLRQVRQHLFPNGHFILDLFIPSNTIQYGETILDYRRKLNDGSVLERWKLIEVDSQPHQVNIICRNYRVVDANGSELRNVSTKERIHYCYPGEAEALIRNSGLSVVATDWDYGATRSVNTARFVTFKCQVC